MPAPAYGDTIGAMTIAGGISAALFHRERTGEADVVDVSLMNTGMWAMGAGISVSLLAGMPWHELAPHRRADHQPARAGATRPRTASSSRCACCRAPTTGRRRASALGIPRVVDDPRFDTNEHFMENAPEAAELVAEAIKGKTLESGRSSSRG